MPAVRARTDPSDGQRWQAARTAPLPAEPATRADLRVWSIVGLWGFITSVCRGVRLIPAYHELAYRCIGAMRVQQTENDRRRGTNASSRTERTPAHTEQGERGACTDHSRNPRVFRGLQPSTLTACRPTHPEQPATLLPPWQSTEQPRSAPEECLRGTQWRPTPSPF